MSDEQQPADDPIPNRAELIAEAIREQERQAKRNKRSNGQTVARDTAFSWDWGEEP